MQLKYQRAEKTRKKLKIEDKFWKWNSFKNGPGVAAVVAVVIAVAVNEETQWNSETF